MNIPDVDNCEYEMDFDLLTQKIVYDKHSFAAMYDKYYDKVFRYCVLRLFNREIAEDTTSEIWLKAAAKIRTFKGKSEDNFKNWVYSIANNEINSHFRMSGKRQKAIAIAKAAAMMSVKKDDPPDIDNEQKWAKLYLAISKLNKKSQSVVLLRFFENMGYEQIAEIMNTKPVTIRVLISRALTKLEQHLCKDFYNEVFCE